MVRSITSWFLVVLMAAGALSPKVIGLPCCAAEEVKAVSTPVVDRHSCCSAPARESEPAAPARHDDRCPGKCNCPKACCAAPALMLWSAAAPSVVLTAAMSGQALEWPQQAAAPAHALSLLRPPRS